MLPKHLRHKRKEPRIDHQPLEILSKIVVLRGFGDESSSLHPPVVSGAWRGTVDATWMVYLNFLLDVQEEFAITLRDRDLVQLTTVADLAALVYEQVQRELTDT